MSSKNLPSTGRNRHFFVRCYHCELQIKNIIASHNVQHYAYILHDHDLHPNGTPKEPHYHVILSLYNSNSSNAVARWFKGFTDNKGLLIDNTYCEACDRFSSFDYLTHETKDCIARKDYIYPKSFIVTDDVGFYFANRESDYDTSTNIVLDLVKGTPYLVMMKRYGKNWILNHQKYIDYVCLMYHNECFKPDSYGIYNSEIYGHDCDLERYEEVSSL